MAANESYLSLSFLFIRPPLVVVSIPLKERRHVSPFSWIGKNEDILLICHSNVCVWTRRGCHRSYLVSRFLTCFFPVRDCFSLGAFRPSVFSCFPFLFLFLFVYFYLFIFFKVGLYHLLRIGLQKHVDISLFAFICYNILWELSPSP